MKYPMNEEKPVACCIESTLSHCSCKLHVATRDQTLVTGAGYGPERDVLPLWTQITHKLIQDRPITARVHTDWHQKAVQERNIATLSKSHVFFLCNARWGITHTSPSTVTADQCIRNMHWNVFTVYLSYQFFFLSDHLCWNPLLFRVWRMLSQTRIRFLKRKYIQVLLWAWCAWGFMMCHILPFLNLIERWNDGGL